MPSDTSVSTRPVLLAIGLTALGVGVAWWIVGFPPLVGAEDAAIGFRYARNVAEGHGIVFNPGGERVEGFTSLSWLLVSAAAYVTAGADALEVVLFLVSLGLTAVTIGVVGELLFSHFDEGRLPWVGVAWLAGQAGFWFWSGLSLMDVAAWGAALAVFLFLIHRRCRGAPLSAFALPVTVVALLLTRPESMMVVPAAVGVAWLVYGVGRGVRRLAVEVGATWALGLGALTAFRLSYFGYPLPNTYYTKASPDVLFRLRTGAEYVLDYLFDHPIGLLAAFAVLAWVLAAVRGRVAVGLGADAPADDRDEVLLAMTAAGLIAAGVGSVVFGGGDHYGAHRFLAAYMPLAALPLVAGIAAFARAREASAGRPLAREVVFGVVIVILCVTTVLDWRAFAGHNLRRQAFDVGLQGRFVAETLNDAFAGSESPELGLWMVGGAGYAYRGPVKDLLGLNWVAMGTSPGDRKGLRDHAAFNVDVFWSAPPELMLPEPRVVLGGMRCIRTVLGGAMQGLLQTDRFEQTFEPVVIQRGDGEALVAYARSDWLESAPQVVRAVGWPYCEGAPPASPSNERNE